MPRNRGSVFSRLLGYEADEPPPVRLGICAMEKKAASKPMRAILELLTKSKDIEVVHFPEEQILNAPVEDWPHPVDVLISFFSEGFPLDKAEAYVALRQPICINDLTSQRILLDRRHVYELLAANDIPHPQAVIVERDPATLELRGAAAKCFEEGDDYLLVGDTKISKPFVEKPVDAEDHNIWIYYPSGAGGGVKRLFRKVGDRASEFDQGHGYVRKDATYMYEPFMKTQGTDIKVYTVGPEYAHAEARKSPVIDGVVNRNEEGKEVRYPVVLTPREKDIAKRICLAFNQMVCGFDLLRTANGSFVIDVNGWSFVKGIPKYYEDAATVLRHHIMHVTGRIDRIRKVDSLLDIDKGLREAKRDGADKRPEDREEDLNSMSSAEPGRSDRWEHEELLAVLAVMRHGDRTPKNKMKLLTRRHEFVGLHKKWASGPHKEVKVKAPRMLQEVLDVTYAIMGKEEEPARPPDLEDKVWEATRLIRAVLETGGHFDGIYRKVQLKPVTWNAADEVEEVLVVLKYGGILTATGVAQAEKLGRVFRGEMYPGEESGQDVGDTKTGLLRLHATQRHDFKVYSSDEGRVQMSAAAFARGLLDLEKGGLTPICVALVETDPNMLDDLPSTALPMIEDAKQFLYDRVTGSMALDRSPGSPDSPGQSASPGTAPGTAGSDRWLPDVGELALEERDTVPNMVEDLLELQAKVRDLMQELESMDESQVSAITKPLLVRRRWQALHEGLWDAKKGTWNISKVPDIHDAVKFDLIHHPRIAKNLVEVHRVSKRLNNVVVPNEYGCDVQSRLRIGSVVCRRLLQKLLADLSNSVAVEEQAPEQTPWRPFSALQYLRWMNPSIAAPEEPKQPERAEDDEEDCQEAEFAGLDTKHVEGSLKSPNRRVRTRLYFTSESHIQTLMNVLRYCHLLPSARRGKAMDPMREVDENEDADAELPCSESGVSDRIVCEEAERRLREQPAFDYLTQIVLRLYENKRCSKDSPERYRVEVLFSPGATGDPSDSSEEVDRHAIAPLRPLHVPDNPLTYARVQELLGACTSTRADATPSSVARRQSSKGSTRPTSEGRPSPS